MSSLTRFTPYVIAPPKSKDSEAFRGINQIYRALESIMKHPLIDGVLVSNLFLPNNVNVQIDHKLGRPWRNWIIARWIGVNNTANTVREGTSSPALNSLYSLELRATNDVTIDVWIC